MSPERWTLRCRAGHEQGVFDAAEAARRALMDEPRCDRGRCRSRRIMRCFTLDSPPGVMADFPEHFNWAFGTVVKNRAHFRQLQRLHKVHDWEPCRNSPGSQLVKDRLRARTTI